MSALSFNLHLAIPAMAMASILLGCASQAKPDVPVVPDYIGVECDPTEMSRIVKSKEIYALCLDHQWMMVSDEQFTSNRVLLKRPVRRPDFVMTKPANITAGGIQNACITVIEYDVGWVDVDYQSSVIRMPLVDGSCSITPCNDNPAVFMESVCR